MTDTLPDLERVYAEAFEGAIVAQESQAEAFRAALLAVYRAGQPKWVSVEERLPETDDTVLVAWHPSGMDTMTGAAVRMLKQSADDQDDDCFITHWQPLPEPPRRTTS